MSFYELPEDYSRRIEEFSEERDAFHRGDIDPLAYKAVRVGFGVYEQRKLGTFMARVRCPGGAITPKQLRCAAELSRSFGGDELHVTTRQELQIHHLPEEHLVEVAYALMDQGLVTKGGGGNTVRNMVASAQSGTSEEDLFDVAPYCFALTGRMITEEDSWSLPRKFKIAFSSGEKDSALATVTDVGFLARLQDGKRGFAVYVAGGMGQKSSRGHLLYRFIPEEDVALVARAVKLVFDRHGNRRNRHQSRLRFLWNKVGEEEFKELVEEELSAVRQSGYPPLDISRPLPQNKRLKDITLQAVPGESLDGFAGWRKRHVEEQSQRGFYRVRVPLVHGNISLEDTARLCDFLGEIGEDTLRLTANQNILLRHIPEAYLGNCYQAVREIGLSKKPALFGEMISCTGASTCQLGLCLSRNLLDEIARTLEEGDISLDALGTPSVNISGCPNCCGQHYVGELGFYGRASRHEGHLYPAYRILAGSVVTDEGVSFAEELGELPSRFIPDFVRKLCVSFLGKKEGYKSFSDYLASGEGKEKIKELIASFAAPPSFEEDESFYTDWGADAPLNLSEIGKGQCSATLFDMVDAGARQIRRHLAGLKKKDLDVVMAEESLYQICLNASRMMLILKGIATAKEDEACRLFFEHFIQTGLLSMEYASIIDAASRRDFSLLLEQKEFVIGLGNDMLQRYEELDDKAIQKINATTPVLTKSASHKEHSLDLAGVKCPMNFVKAKTALEEMKKGDVLHLFLDDGEPIENVPASIRALGHVVIEQEQKSDKRWHLAVRKESSD